MLIDTNIAILLRDGDRPTIDQIADIDAPLMLSIVSLVELEGGVVAVPAIAAYRRAALDALLEDIEVLEFRSIASDAYRRIVEQRGYSRPKILDRMIAATAIAYGLPLLTRNPRDFAGIDGLILAE